ncbi:Os04g0509500, partial [Oryza sativa Japonica Group]
VREPAVPCQVHAGRLVLGGDAEQAELLEPVEERSHGAADPPEDDQDLDDVRGEQLAAAAHEQAVRPAGAVDLLDVLLPREERGEEDPPRAAPAVELGGLERVVELEARGERVEADEHPRRDEPADDRGPRVDDAAPGGDGGEPAEEAVADVDHVPVPRLEPLPEQRGERRHAAGQGRRHGGAADSGPLPVDAAGRAVRLEDGGERPGVESVPAEPQQEGAKHDERRAVALERHRSAGVVEPPDAGALDERAPEPGDTADHVDDAGAGEVDDTGAEQQRSGRAGGRGPPIGGPDPVGHHRVDEPGEEGGVDEVGDELRPLGDGARRDPGGGDGEGPLEEEEVVVEPGLRHVLEAEELLPDEAVGRRAEGEGEAEEVVEERPGRGVEHVGEHDVHRVLGPHRPGAEHREPELHGEHEVRREEQVRRVHRRRRVGEPVAQVVRRVRRHRPQQRRQVRRARRHLPPSLTKPSSLRSLVQTRAAETAAGLGVGGWGETLAPDL